MRVLLTGGGTAGHINPALAIAEIVLQNDPNAEILFAGVKEGKESELIPREGYKIEFVKSQGIDRRKKKWSPTNLRAYWLAATSPYAPRTVNIIKCFKPDIVIGTGGFACWPIMSAAVRMGIPTAVHESNAFPGLTTRRLRESVGRIWVNFEETKKRLGHSDRIVQVGNPLRRGFGTMSYHEARQKLGLSPDTKFILSFGGSMGAEYVNDGVIDMMCVFSKEQSNVLHMHACGTREWDRCKPYFDSLGLDRDDRFVLTDYIYDMPVRMAAADLVISRAGAMTLSELALMKKTCILIPSPHVTDNHQYINAKTIADGEGAILVEEKDLPTGKLTEAVREILDDPARATRMQSAIADFANADANKRIWQDILELTK